MTMSATARRWSFVTAVVLALGLALPTVAAAAPPSNDDFDTATAVTALPYTAQGDTTEATKASDDPWCDYSNKSVWFAYTPVADVMLRATVEAGTQSTLSAYTGARGELAPVPDACRGSSASRPAVITFRAYAGTTYHFMVAGYADQSGPVSFALQEVEPAPNDDFADAEPVTALPATRAIDLSVASTEYDEPLPTCAYESRRSVWYTFTAAETASLVASVADSGEHTVSVHTGSTLPALTEIGCARGDSFEEVLFRATAGTTYHLRVAGPATAATLTFAEAPPLRPYFIASSDPTIYELTHFTGYTGESGTPIAGGEWDFGDGTVVAATEDGVSHHYTADGTYTVRLSVVSPDGRTGSHTSTVTVSTHDVSISRFSTPSRATAGDTEEIAVRVTNTRYRETVTTTLYRSRGEYWDVVGTLTLDVPVGRVVTFPFAYTFTDGDAVAGKVAFRAVVTLPYPVRDARPFDNELISTGTTVRPAPAGA
ncbi:PKD domain-containing protein [Actinophytocola sp. NPDC049390]|uniref:PKD domain-containing protein n=1 Tax=Actinophytocola sp. NPDC049390 TaxID=3363894 RepID=UPI0037A0D915